MKILKALLVLRLIAVAESEDTLSASNHAILAKNNLESFLTETSAATSDQILFRADSQFTSDTAYNRFFSVLVKEAYSSSISQPLEFYLDNINKLHHVWANYIAISAEHAKKLFKVAVKKNDLPEHVTIRLRATSKTIQNIHTYLEKWGATIICLGDYQLKKARRLGYSEPFKLQFFTQPKIEGILKKLSKYISLLEDRIKENEKRQSNKENQPINRFNSLEMIPPLNLADIKKDEILQLESQIKSPRQLTPRKLIKSLSDRILKNSHRKVEILGSPPTSWNRNTIVRAKSADE